MNRSFTQKLAARLAVVVVLAGAAIAAVTATGQTPSYTPAAARQSAQRVARRGLAAAASYLGVGVAQLESDLASGKTLAEVAGATSGKSEAGLIESLVAARKQKLTLAAASLTKRVTAEVSRSGGPGASIRSPRWRRLFAAPNSLGFVAASYLGVPVTQLQGELRSGKTLAQVANATSGRSEAGLIEALVAARQTGLDAAVSSGKLAPAKANALAANLSKRMARLVDSTPAKHRRAPSKG